MDCVLRLLVKHCPKTLPTSGKLYGGHNLKQMLDTRKPGLIEGKPRANKRLWLKKLPYMKEWLSKAARGRRKEMRRWADCYDATTFTDSHEQHKDEALMRFVSLLRKSSPTCKILVLDDFEKKHRRLRCLSALLKHRVPCRLYVANPSASVCKAAKKMKVNVFQGELERALASDFDESFGAFYLDGCSGSPRVLCGLVDRVLCKANQRFALALTIVGRCSLPGHGSQVNRIRTVEQHLKGHGFAPFGTGLNEYALVYGQVCTVYYYRE